MSKKNIIIIIISIAVVFIGIGFIWYQRDLSDKNVDILDDGTKVNKSAELNKNRELDGLEISNIKFYYDTSGVSIIEFEAYNPSELVYLTKRVLINVLDKNNNTIHTLLGNIPYIDTKSTEKLVFSVDKDIVDAYDLSFEMFDTEEDDEESEDDISNEDEEKTDLE